MHISSHNTIDDISYNTLQIFEVFFEIIFAPCYDMSQNTKNAENILVSSVSNIIL